jgi:hypothetical protein
MREIQMWSRLVLVLALVVTVAGCGWCPLDGRESSGDKREWSILQALEARSRSDSTIGVLEARTVDGYEVVAVPREGTPGRIWIMLAPQSPPFYKQIPPGPYVLDHRQVEKLIRSRKVSSTVQEVLWSHSRDAK